MTIDKVLEGDKLTVRLEGSLNTLSAPELENVIHPCLPDVNSITIDMTNLNYISSAGLRVLLVAYTDLNERGGTLLILNPNDEIREIFDVTSFSSFLNIQQS